jgi:hypothetical protein
VRGRTNVLAKNYESGWLFDFFQRGKVIQIRPWIIKEQISKIIRQTGWQGDRGQARRA